MAKELLSAAKIATELGLPAGRVKTFIEQNKIEPLEVKGKCCYYDAKTVNAVEKEYFLSAANVAKKLELPAAKVKSFLQSAGIQPDRVKGNCNYYGPKTWDLVKKGVK